MAFKRNAVALGTPPRTASALIGGSSFSLTALGSTQGTALLLSASVNEFTTVATATGLGAQLGMADPGDDQYVYNGGAQTLSVYGQSGEGINNGSANAAYTVAANKGVLFKKVSPTRWSANLTA